MKRSLASQLRTNSYLRQLPVAFKDLRHNYLLERNFLPSPPYGFSCPTWNPSESGIARGMAKAIAAGGSRGELLVWPETPKGKGFG